MTDSSAVVTASCPVCGLAVSGRGRTPEAARGNARTNLQQHQKGRRCWTRAQIQKRAASSLDGE